MLLTDLTVEVRDPDLNRVGQLMPTDLVGAVFVSRYNNVGSWQVRLANGSPMGELLRQPGYGIVVTGPMGVIISGPTLGATLEQTVDNLQGDWVIDGADDSLLLQERLAYPQPANSDVATQAAAYDSRTGFAETVIKGYVRDNISLLSGTDRAVAYLSMQTDLARGSTVNAQARFDNLQELCYNLATTGGIGYTIEQNGSLLEFQVYEPQNLAGIIRMDLDNGKLSRTEYSYLSPKVTRAILGGSGEALDRVFFEGTTAASILAEGQWGRRIESFVDDRQNADLVLLGQRADELLVEDGKTIVNTSVTPSDDVNMRYGFDWGLGDLVTVVIGDIESSAIVTEVGISIEADGVRIGATVGDPAPIEFESKIIVHQQVLDSRISHLERTEQVIPTYTYALPSLTDVLLASNSDGQVLTYEAASSKWKNKSLPVVSVAGDAPVTKTASFTVVDTDVNIICQGTATVTVTLPAPALFIGRTLCIKTLAAFTVVSASANVLPITSATAGTAILAATAGKFATLVSNGTNWVIMAAN